MARYLAPELAAEMEREMAPRWLGVGAQLGEVGAYLIFDRP